MDNLTPTQLQILVYALEGYRNDKVVEMLGLGGEVEKLLKKVEQNLLTI